MDTEMQMTAASNSAAVGQQQSEGIQRQMPMDDGTALPQNGARITFENFLGQGRVNQLGGVFINGRPLPHEKRVQIVEMARRGIKPCKISRELKVSHGAVSKILNRFHETGSISPGQIGGNPRSRLSIQAVRQHILRLREEQPSLSAGQVQQMLVQRSICSRQNVPSSSRINRLLKAYKQQQQQQQQRAKPRPKSAGDSGAAKSGGEKALSHSIENILGDNGGKQSPNGHANGTIGGAEVGRPSAVVSPPSSSASSVSSSNAAQIAPGSDEENQQHQQHSQNDTFLADGRRARTSFSAKQLRILEQTFKNSPYPTPQQKECLIKVTELDEDKIITWFSNRRARNRRKAFQQQQHPPPQQILSFSSANSTATSPQSSIAVNTTPMAMSQNSICPPALFPFPAAAFFPTLFAPTGAFTPFGLLAAANGGTSTAAMNLNCAVSAVQNQQKMCVDGTAEK